MADNRRRAGRQSQRSGDSLERYLGGVHALLEASGRAVVRKVPTPIKITSAKGAAVTGRKMAAEWTDYAGTLEGGRSVLFEAKSVGANDAPRFDFGRLESKGTGANQIDVLATASRFGALAFVYVRHHVDAFRLRDFVLPVAADRTIAGRANDSAIRGSRSIRLDGVVLGGQYRLGPTHTWLDVLEALELTLDPELLEARRFAESMRDARHQLLLTGTPRERFPWEKA